MRLIKRARKTKDHLEDISGEENKGSRLTNQDDRKSK